MSFLLDTANIDRIKKYTEYYPITGVTTNPSIMAKEGGVPFFPQLRAIRNIIGRERSLHAQVIGETAEEMVRQAHVILENVDDLVFIKIPVTSEGLKAIKILKRENIRVTATVVYDLMQAYLAADAGADYIAPYCSRIEKTGRDFAADIEQMRLYIDDRGASSLILGASFHAVDQITRAIFAGAHDVTLSPEMLAQCIDTPYVTDAVSKFSADWKNTYGEYTF